MSVTDTRAVGVHRALAPAKVNLGLFVGSPRVADGKHELVSVMQSISLADELMLESAGKGAEHDELHCPGVEVAPQENLALAALRAFRESTGWDAPPLRLRVVKRIPVAAGLGGGSADAAAVLRLARHASGLGDERLLRTLAQALGADVPAQIEPGRWLAAGVGERLQRLSPARTGLALLVAPVAAELSTAAVYKRADLLAEPRTPGELHELWLAMRAALEHGEALPAQARLLHNDLQRAAVSLCPQISGALAEARGAGAELALVSGSGPTVVGLFARAGESPKECVARARLAAAELADRTPAPLCATPVDAAFARAVTLEAG